MQVRAIGSLLQAFQPFVKQQIFCPEIVVACVYLDRQFSHALLQVVQHFQHVSLPQFYAANFAGRQVVFAIHSDVFAVQVRKFLLHFHNVRFRRKAEIQRYHPHVAVVVARSLGHFSRPVASATHAVSIVVPPVRLSLPKRHIV